MENRKVYVVYMNHEKQTSYSGTKLFLSKSDAIKFADRLMGRKPECVEVLEYVLHMNDSVYLRGECSEKPSSSS